jgi:MrcB-like, N-terminal domain/Domain of unknown function (DUF3883)
MSLQQDFEEVLSLAPQFSTPGTPAMKARDVAIARIEKRLREAVLLLAQEFGLQELELRADGGGRQANYSPTAWVRVYSRRFSPTAMSGYYIAYLFAADGSRVYLSLMQGTSEFRSGGMRPINDRDKLQARAAEARYILRNSVTESDSVMVSGLVGIDLAWRAALGVGRESRLRIRNYEDANITAHGYPSGSVPTDGSLLQDLSDFLPLLAELYQQRLARPLAQPQQAIDPSSRLLRDIAQATRARSQGRIIDPQVRVAIEKYAEDAALAILEMDGWTVKRVGPLHLGYDLECTKELASLHVEVKGTQTHGEEVVLTPNEVRHHQGAGQCSSQHALFVLADITVIQGEQISCQDGKPLMILPWRLEEAALTPTEYSYRIPR